MPFGRAPVNLVRFVRRRFDGGTCDSTGRSWDEPPPAALVGARATSRTTPLQWPSQGRAREPEGGTRRQPLGLRLGSVARGADDTGTAGKGRRGPRRHPHAAAGDDHHARRQRARRVPVRPQRPTRRSAPGSTPSFTSSASSRQATCRLPVRASRASDSETGPTSSACSAGSWASSRAGSAGPADVLEEFAAKIAGAAREPHAVLAAPFRHRDPGQPRGGPSGERPLDRRRRLPGRRVLRPALRLRQPLAALRRRRSCPICRRPGHWHTEGFFGAVADGRRRSSR